MTDRQARGEGVMGSQLDLDDVAVTSDLAMQELLEMRAEIVCLRAEIEALRAEVERLKSMTAVTMGVGSGDGNLFVHGDCESIKAAQAIVLERGALRAEVERLSEALRGWWEAYRPVGWTEDQHRSCPHVNLATATDKALADAMLKAREASND